MHYLSSPLIVVLIMLMAAVQQGCLAAAWVAAVGADSMRSGDVRFQPFEASWISNEPATAIVNRSSLSSLAVLPVEGDEAMADRLTKLLEGETSLRVIRMTRVQRPGTVTMSDEERATLARELSGDIGVDAVLYGHVICAAPHSSVWGWKTQESRRLFLYMIDRDGHLLWKDELPFLVMTAAKPALEESVQMSLTRHFMDHVHALGLDAAGYLPSKFS